LQFSIKQLLVGVAVVAVILGIWCRYLRRIVDVRPADASDRVRERYFGIDSPDMKARNILVVTGCFTRSTWLSGRLYHVQAGRFTQLQGMTVGRSTNRLGEWIWQDMTITLALGDKVAPGGRLTCLGSVGQHRGGGSGGEVSHNVEPQVTVTLPGRISAGRDYIVYVEGDRTPVVDRNASLANFARENGGNYLVVTLQLQ
jgi:hypothetical protein